MRVATSGSVPLRLAGLGRLAVTGLAVIVRVAAAARHGELGPFTEAVGQGDPAALAGQVRWLLEQSGEAEAAEALMGQLGAGP